MADRINGNGKGGVVADQLPRIKLVSTEREKPKEKATQESTSNDSAAHTITLSTLSRSIANNSQASSSLSRVLKKSPAETRLLERKEVEEANRSASEASVEDVEDLAEGLVRDISFSPEEALDAFNGGSRQTVDLLK